MAQPPRCSNDTRSDGSQRPEPSDAAAQAFRLDALALALEDAAEEERGPDARVIGGLRRGTPLGVVALVVFGLILRGFLLPGQFG